MNNTYTAFINITWTQVVSIAHEDEDTVRIVLNSEITQENR